MSSAAIGRKERLSRSLGLWDLVFMGIILVQPTAPMPLFGVVSEKAQGHVVTTILIAMGAMLLTALSYGRMARAYPSAGSAYTYVGQEIHPAFGYVTGWSMLLDYAVNPAICTIWCSKAAMNILPQVPYPLWAAFFALLFTTMNLRRIQATARTNEVLAIAMGVVIFWMLGASVRYVLRLPGFGAADLTIPFYDPATFDIGLVSAGTATAVLTYIGFDAISTLSEEVKNPRRNVLLATVLVCLLTGLLSSLEVYAAQLVWPYGEAFPDVDTAYVHVAGRAGGPVLFQLVNLTLLVATIGSGSGAQLAGARLLYGMGRDAALPVRIFGTVDPRTLVPRNNVILLGTIGLVGALSMSYEIGADLLNFGALIGFMGVNLAALVRYFVRSEQKRMRYLLPPVLGFAVCFYMWINLRPLAKFVGAVWLVVGLLYGAWKTAGFRRDLVRFEVPQD